ncbi:MAG: hypothetical protein ACXVHX_37765, partial [Solirubrobacteraceae bacterium]
MIYEAATSGVLHAVWTVVICIVLVLLELLAVALLVAPRAVTRKLISLLGALARRGLRIFRPPSPRRQPARPTR